MNEQRNRPVLTFVGVVLLLVGLYGTFRTIVNIIAFERYPQEAVFSTSSFGTEYAPLQREEDCDASYSYIAPIYYQADNVTPRKATDVEMESDAAYKAQQEMNKQNCITGIQETRKAAMVNDISQSAIFLLLALCALCYTRLFKNPITLKI